MDKFCYPYLLEKSVIVVGVSIAVPPLLIWLEYVCLHIASRDTLVKVSGSIKVLEYVFWIEEFGINSLRSKEFAANNKYLCRDVSVNCWSLRMDAGQAIIPGGRRFRCFNFTEQLVEDPDEVVVVLTSKHLCDECSSFDEKFYRELQTHEDQFRLSICVLYPGRPNVWCAIVEYHIGLPVLELISKEVATMNSGDVRGKSCHSWNWLYSDKVNA
jgi:hypothetical protein